MKTKVSEQVARFVRSLAPAPRRKMRLAFKALAAGRGDIKALEGALTNYSRLRVSSYRVILFYRDSNHIECIFAEHRSIVYEIFENVLRERLGRER
jgi:mRNA-degrading endonuclease RelE of RelBE toxin-antitoxin system